MDLGCNLVEMSRKEHAVVRRHETGHLDSVIKIGSKHGGLMACSDYMRRILVPFIDP